MSNTDLFQPEEESHPGGPPNPPSLEEQREDMPPAPHPLPPPGTGHGKLHHDEPDPRKAAEEKKVNFGGIQHFGGERNIPESIISW